MTVHEWLAEIRKTYGTTYGAHEVVALANWAERVYAMLSDPHEVGPIAFQERVDCLERLANTPMVSRREHL